jgi:nicotinamide-nucleotide amidase
MSGQHPAIGRAEIIAVGTEMLGGGRTDTNSVFLTRHLEELGIEVQAKSVVADDFQLLERIVAEALARTELVLVTGGLGPTDDDVTRAAVAAALGRPLDEDEAIVAAIRTRFVRRGYEMPSINRRQGMVIGGAVVLPNAVGTAPGQWVEVDCKVIVLLPGPPRELEPMFLQEVKPRLETRVAGEQIVRRTVRLIGRTESHAEERLRPLYAAWRAQVPPVTATILAGRGQIELHLASRSIDPAVARRALAGATADVEQAFGRDVCSTDGRALEEVVGDLLREKSLRIAIAESCTAGMIAARLTAVPGSSAYVEGGVVAYSNQAKVALLGVPLSVIEEHGAVSEPVAVAMAEGARAVLGAGVGVGVTGIAGPGGGSEGKPVGTVVVAVAGPGPDVVARTFLFPGTRQHVRVFSTTAALDMVRRSIQFPA